MKFELKREIFLHDTDATGMVYYSRIFEWLEAIRIKFFQEIVGMKFSHYRETEKKGWMPTEAVATYKKPVMLEDKIVIKMSTDHVKSIRFDLKYEIFRINENGDEELTNTAFTPMASVDLQTGRPCKLDPAIIEKLKLYCDTK